MSRAQKRADRIRAEVPITRVLSDYGYNVREAGGDREQQFSCDLHGGGRDLSPSARVYPGSSSVYCFGCGRPRDAIQYAREKEGIDFWGAIKVLEERYHLPPLPWEDEDEALQIESLPDKVKATLQTDATFDEVQSRVKRKLERLTIEREMPMPRILTLWEAFDQTCYEVAEGNWQAEKGKVQLLRILDKANAE